MHLPVILRITGILLTFFSVTLLAPAAVALIYNEPAIETFAMTFAITLIAGLSMWLPLRRYRDLRAGDGFFVTVLFLSRARAIWGRCRSISPMAAEEILPTPPLSPFPD